MDAAPGSPASEKCRPPPYERRGCPEAVLQVLEASECSDVWVPSQREIDTSSLEPWTQRQVVLRPRSVGQHHTSGVDVRRRLACVSLGFRSFFAYTSRAFSVDFRLLFVCYWFDFRLLFACFALAFRLIFACVSFAFRVRFACLPIAFRLSFACFSLAFRLLLACVSLAFRVHFACFFG